MTRDVPGHERPDDLLDKRRATWAGIALNLPLGLGKIGLGWASGSQALVADGVHSLSDLGSDAALLWALRHSHRPPDADHPFGHRRFETIATLVVAGLLFIAAVGIVLDAGLRVLDPPTEAPGTLALWVALASILLKEGLFHYARAVGRRTGSSMMIANAWHHRSDALSSVVALVGIGAALAGVMIADAIAAAVIAVMLGHVAWTLAAPALSELVDAAPDAGEIGGIEAEIRAVPGVRDVHALRLRMVGGALRGDGHVTFDGAMTLSEAHRLTEAARARVLAAFPEVLDILLHAEPEGHADGPAAHDAPLRPEIEQLLHAELAATLPDHAISALRLDYRDDGLRVVMMLDPPIGDGTELPSRLSAVLRAQLGIAATVVLTRPDA